MKKIKNQKGITLIALVITIIILLILAGVALSIVFNGGIIEKSQNAVDTYNSSSKNEEEKLADLETKFQQLYNERVAGKEGNGEDTSGGSSNGDNVDDTPGENSGENNGENTPGGGPGDSAIAEWTIVTDYGATGLSLGDIVKPINANLENESFYVIGIDGTGATQTVRLLAYKNVLLASISTEYDRLHLCFNNNKSKGNEYATSDIKEKVEEYVGKLTTAGLTLEDVETAERGETISGVKGRLMWGTNSGGEVQEVLAINETGEKSITGSTIVYGTGTNVNSAYYDYWLGSPVDNTSDCAWFVQSGGSITYLAPDGKICVNNTNGGRSSPSYKSIII